MEAMCCTFWLWAFLSFLVVLSVPIALILVPAILTYVTPNGRRMRKLINQIPGPPFLPVIGHVLAVVISRQKILEYRYQNCIKYYPVYKLWFLQQPLVNVVGPEYVEAILHSSKHIEKGWVYKFLKPWLGEGLLTSGGDKWFAHRKMLTPTFHFKILEEFLPMFRENSAALADRLSVEAVTGKPFDIVPIISQCTLDIICESAMGIKLDREDEDQQKYIAAIYTYGEIFYSRIVKPWYGIDSLFNISPLARKQTKTLKILHSFTENVIKDKKMEYIKNKSKKSDETDEKRKRKRVKAFLELLIELSMEENLLTDQEIREEVDTFMFEGHDTTSMALCWTMFMLANHQDIQEKVWEEVESCFGAKDKRMDGEDSEESAATIFREMPLLERCIKETQRLYPSVPFISRVLTEDFQLEKYLIPSGSMVNIVISGIHRNPNTFPDPDKFDPDRFLPEAIRDRHPYAYVPFSAGPRNCIGQRFAMLEVKCILSTLIHRYKLIAVDKPEEVKFMHDLVLRPCNGIRIKLETRETCNDILAKTLVQQNLS